MFTKQEREEKLATLLNRAVQLLPDGPEADRVKVDAQEFLIDLLSTQWAGGEAPPGIEAIQADVAEAAKEADRAARNKRKASARRAATRSRNRR